MSFEFPKTTTLCYILNDEDHVLLIMKKRGFGAGKWNGPGGKVQEDESPLDAAVREVREEIGVVPREPEEIGYIEFIWEEIPENNNRCFVYLTRDFEGNIIETEECLPAWFAQDKIPYGYMWEDDQLWYPEMLQGRRVKKRFYFNKDNKLLKHENIEE